MEDIKHQDLTDRAIAVITLQVMVRWKWEMLTNLTLGTRCCLVMLNGAMSLSGSLSPWEFRDSEENSRRDFLKKRSGIVSHGCFFPAVFGMGWLCEEEINSHWQCPEKEYEFTWQENRKIMLTSMANLLKWAVTSDTPRFDSSEDEDERERAQELRSSAASHLEYEEAQTQKGICRTSKVCSVDEQMRKELGLMMTPRISMRGLDTTKNHGI